MAEQRRPVVLTTDCGTEMDDQWAIAHLALIPEIELKGIVTNHAPNLAPPASETAARFVNEVLDQLVLPDRPPVVAGASSPLLDKKTPAKNLGVEFILETSKRYSPNDRLTVLVIGTATDVASALLIDPTVAERIDIVAMGFNGWPDGDDVWNVKNDVAAWQILMGSDAPITVGDSAVCSQRLSLTKAAGSSLLENTGSAGQFLAKLLSDWIDTQTELIQLVSGGAGSWPVWDEIVVAHLLGMTKSTTYPRPALRDNMTFERDAPSGTIQWIVDVDAERLWNDLATRLSENAAQR